jgi:Flp pilus assembly protein TadG
MRPRRRHQYDGQALVELALLALLLATMAFAVLEVGRAFYLATALTHAVREGARAGIDPERSPDQIEQRAREAAQPVELTTLSVTRSGATVTVTATVSFDTPAPLVANLWGGGPLVIERSFVARMAEPS